MNDEFRCNWYGIGDIIQFSGFLRQWMETNRKRPKLHVISWYAQEILERYKVFFDLLPEEQEGPYLLDSDRRKWYSDHRLPFVNTGFYPVLAEERAWAENYWGPKRPRWFVQLHGSGPEKSHRHWEQLIRFIHGYCGGQTLCLDDAAIEGFTIAQGLALAATCDRFVGFDSGPFWAATANGAEAVALFPGGSPDTLYPVSAKPRIKVAYCPRSADRVPISDVVQFVIDHWGIATQKGAQPRENEDGLYFLGENCHAHLYEGHERWLEPWMLDGLTETSVAADVGMHVGSWTMKLAQRCARVYSVEPSDGPRTCAQMTARVRGHENIVFHACALGEKSGTARLHEEEGGSHLAKDGPEVRVCTFDELFAGLNRLDLVKIDTEGAEAMILRGGREAISALRPRMVIEVHAFAAGLFDADPYGAILTELGHLGYSSKRIGGHDANFYLQALPTRGRRA